MPSTLELVEVQRPRAGSWLADGPWFGMGWCALLTGAVLLLGGYHPYMEDGGLYLAGVRWELEPGLYAGCRGFVTAHLHYSAFAPLLAMATRSSGWRLETVVLLAYLLCTWGTVWGGWLLAGQIFRERREQIGATVMLAAGLQIPVAGTSLVLADPYLTARSASTAGCVLGLAAVLRGLRQRDGASGRRWMVCAGVAFALSAAMHPLMAGYGAVCAALVLGAGVVPRQWQLRITGGVTASALLLCGVMVWRAPEESTAARLAGLSRSYWFPTQWAWYELVGLVAPVLLLCALARGMRRDEGRVLVRGTVAAGLVAGLVAIVFARPGMASFAVARMQPLRLFQTVFLVLFVILGGMLGRWLGRGRWWFAMLALGAVPLLCERAIAPDLPRLEIAGMGRTSGESGWVEAFEWARANTPRDAMFALDANYIEMVDEDAESFRAIAERSSLPDAAKDGGEAAITPRLADAWQRGVWAQRGLSVENDQTRRSRLLPLGVSWLVLQRSAVTALPCPFRNRTVMVCRLSER